MLKSNEYCVFLYCVLGGSGSAQSLILSFSSLNVATMNSCKPVSYLQLRPALRVLRVLLTLNEYKRW